MPVTDLRNFCIITLLPCYCLFNHKKKFNVGRKGGSQQDETELEHPRGQSNMAPVYRQEVGDEDRSVGRSSFKMDPHYAKSSE